MADEKRKGEVRLHPLCSAEKAEMLKQELNIEDADIVADLTGGKLLCRAYRTRIALLKEEMAQQALRMKAVELARDAWKEVCDMLFHTIKQVVKIMDEGTAKEILKKVLE